jgi:two-component system, NarL family, nitrate/nitrite response regulator NarL
MSPNSKRFHIQCNIDYVAKVGILEDDSLMRISLRESLSALGYQIAFDSGSPGEFLKKARNAHIDVALLDVHLGRGITGVDVGYSLRAVYPTMGLVFITSFTDPRMILSGDKALPENSVYLEKAKIKSMKNIALALDQSMSGAGKSSMGSSSEPRLLTDKQIKVLRLVAQGQSNSQIAIETRSSVKNVEAIISRIIKLLELRGIETQNQRVHMARAYFRFRGVNLED